MMGNRPRRSLPGAVPLPRRPRRWFTPTSAALLALVLGFAGFYAGVREEKTRATGSGSTLATGSRSAPATGSGSAPATGSGSAPATGSGSAPATGSGSRRAVSPTAATGSAGGVTAGTVTRVDGDTVYVKESSGSTVEIKLLRTTAIDKSVDVSSHSVRPGDSVTIQGTRGSGGAITSTSISDSGNNSTTTTSTSQAAAASSAG